MKILAIKILVATCLLLSLMGCTTNDFKVVDALKIGMSKNEARSVIESFSFELETDLTRPASGWGKSDDTFFNLSGRAKQVESEFGIKVLSAEYYPVGHGLFGSGQLFLFYDQNEKLVHCYRKQIN
jgi:hypothetical protein